MDELTNGIFVSNGVNLSGAGGSATDAKSVKYGTSNVEDELDAINENLSATTLFDTETTLGSSTLVEQSINLSESFKNFDHIIVTIKDAHVYNDVYVDCDTLKNVNSSTLYWESIVNPRNATTEATLRIKVVDDTTLAIGGCTYNQYWTRTLVKIKGYKS